MMEKMAQAFILACMLFAILLLITLSLNPLSYFRQTRMVAPAPKMKEDPGNEVAFTSTNTTHVTRKPFVILVYTEFFGTKEWIKIDGDCSLPEVRKTSCTKNMFDLTYDKRRFSESEFVIFHARDMPGLDHLKTILKDKPSSQFWVYFLQESPNATPNTAPLNGMFDLTFTYRVDSDFWAPYGDYVEIPFTSPSQQDFSVGKSKLVSWMVSNCGSSVRNSFVRKLQKYIAVDVFGACSGQFGQSRSCERGEACKSVIKQYKFYLSFENALCEDYVTEKYWGHLGDENIVPIVMGGANYTRLAIPGSYINVLDFKTVKDLADYLHYLDKNNTAYNDYFNWRQKYRTAGYEHSFVCNFCKMVTSETQLKRTNRHLDLTDFWVRQGKCNLKDELVRKM